MAHCLHRIHLRHTARSLAVISLVVIALPATAQGDPVPAPPPDYVADSEWTVIVSPYVWAASLSGDVGLAGIGGTVHLPFSDIFENLDMVAMGNVEVVKGRVGGWVDGQYVKTSQQEQLLGMPVDVSVRTTRGSTGLFYKALVVDADQGRTLSLEPAVGVRWTNLSVAASAPIAATRQSVDWAEPFVGGRINADLTRRWNLFVEADWGIGGGSTSSANAQAYLGYRARIGGRPAIFRLGYRYITQTYRTPDFTGLGDFVWDMEQQGPAAGVSIVF